MPLFLDLESRSSADLNLVGVDNYSRNESTQVILIGYAIDDSPTNVLQGSPFLFPQELMDALYSENVPIVAHNSTFERYMLKYVLHIDIPTSRFFDTLPQARFLSMPGSLEKVCEILKLEEGKLDGDKLKDLFCSPAHPGGEETLFGISEPRYNDWNSNPREWSDFIEYCRRDVGVLREIYKIFQSHPLPECEKEGWLLDQKINDRGMPVDLELVQKMDKIATRAKKEAFDAIKLISGVENPNSGPQLLKWLGTQGYKASNLQKPSVNRALEDIGLSGEAAQVLELRKENAKTSDSKLEALKLAISPDGFVRDQFSYLGAGRTGRWSGHGVQLHNLPRPTKEVEKNLDRLVEMLLAEDYEGIKSEFSVMDVIAGCIRPCFMAPPGYEFAISDLSAIEHRVVGWLSGCDAILEVHRQGKDPYLDFAELLFKVPYEEMVNGNKCKPEFKDMRQLAKPPVLGCGFGLSGGEDVPICECDHRKKDHQNGSGACLIKKCKCEEYSESFVDRDGLYGYSLKVCNVDMPLDLARKAVGLYRERYSEVCDFWWNIEESAIQVIRTKKPVKLRKLVLDMHGQTFRIQLPSGRYLHYIRPRVIQQEFRGKLKDTIIFEGKDTKGWGQQQTYGGKLTENVTQAVARDILLEGMKLADKRGVEIVGHVHDEIVALAKQNEKILDILLACMRTSSAWAKDLPLGAEGFTTRRYRKG